MDTSDFGLKSIRGAKQALTSRHNDWLNNHSTEELYRRPIHAHRIERILELTANIQGNVLDIGCFDGYIGQKIQEQGNKQVIGLDRVENGLEIASDRGIETHYADIDDADFVFPDDTFDCVLAADVLNYAYDPDSVVSEIRRVLISQGALIITTPNLASVENRIRMLFGRHPLDLEVRAQQGVGNVRLFTFKTLRDLLVDNGFIVCSIESDILFFPLFFVTWMTNLVFRSKPERKVMIRSTFLAKIFPKLGKSIIVVAQKSGPQSGKNADCVY